MDPTTFPCMVCNKLMVVPPEMAGRPVRCPHCKEISIAPSQSPVQDQPVFSKPAEMPDSILSESDASEDSVLDDGVRRGFPLAPPDVSPQGPSGMYSTPAHPIQPYSPSYSAPQPMQPMPVYVPPQMPVYYTPPMQPAPQPEPEPVLEDSPSPRRQKPVSAPLPIREIIIGGLAMYAFVITIVAVIGWTRSPQVQHPISQVPKAKSTKR
jgi:phage FluMu protein Com